MFGLNIKQTELLLNIVFIIILKHIWNFTAHTSNYVNYKNAVSNMT